MSSSAACSIRISSPSRDSLPAKRVSSLVPAALMASLERRASRVFRKFKAKAADSRGLLSSVSSRIKRTSYYEKQERKGRPECRAVWQKAILMGDRCQPPDFSGVIYYDEKGKRIDQFPYRSPRNSPLPSYAAKPLMPVASNHDQLRLLHI